MMPMTLNNYYQNPLDVKAIHEAYGKRYTFWYLTEVCNCSVSRTLYLILLSI